MCGVLTSSAAPASGRCVRNIDLLRFPVTRAVSASAAADAIIQTVFMPANLFLVCRCIGATTRVD
jgi:hypothetical protein